MRSLLLGAAASLALGSAANATTINGWYVSLEGGANWVEDWDHADNFTAGGVVTAVVPGSASFDTGWAVLASVGYGWNKWRFEFEAGYRDNDGDGATFAGAPFPASVLNFDLSEVSLMANVIYDIPLTERMSLSLGAGAGADYAMMDHNFFLVPVEDEDWRFAYQGIAGLNYAIGRQTDLFVNYRYFRVADPEFDYRPVLPLIVAGDDIVKHTVTVGLRYAFGAPAAEPVVAPPPPPPPAPEPAAPREFIVFFGHNKSNLTAEAQNVIREAAAAAKQFGSATITVVGHADRSGSDGHNQKLSLRRANVVKDQLVREGIAEGSISVSGRGETEPMVQTADGVREPQNRRVHISL
jgi:outer membrane protein OmpA-like peptidoglycan-associated protein